MKKKLVFTILLSVLFLSLSFTGLAQTLNYYTITGKHDDPIMFTLGRPTVLHVIEDNNANILSEASCGQFYGQAQNGLLVKGTCLVTPKQVAFMTFDKFSQYSQYSVYTSPVKNRIVDGHDAAFDSDGNYYLIVMRRRESDLISHSTKMTRVMDFGYQKVTSNGDLIFEVIIGPNIVLESEATITSMNTIGAYQHMWVNSIDVDNDYNVYLSARNISAILKFDKNGNYVWQLGGIGSDFSTQDGPLFCAQHDVQKLDNGNIILFNNGFCNEINYASGIELEVDEINMIYTKTWEYHGGKNYLATHHGSVQRLSNGDTLIGWGSAPLNSAEAPNATVVNAEGKIRWEMFIEPKTTIYRVKSIDETIRRPLFLPLLIE